VLGRAPTSARRALVGFRELFQRPLVSLTGPGSLGRAETAVREQFAPSCYLRSDGLQLDRFADLDPIQAPTPRYFWNTLRRGPLSGLCRRDYLRLWPWRKSEGAIARWATLRRSVDGRSTFFRSRQAPQTRSYRSPRKRRRGPGCVAARDAHRRPGAIPQYHTTAGLARCIEQVRWRQAGGPLTKDRPTDSSRSCRRRCCRRRRLLGTSPMLHMTAARCG
jgi:hypothetical protein